MKKQVGKDPASSGKAHNTGRALKFVLASLYLLIVSLGLAGCGSGGGEGVSSQVVSGVASVGAPLAGQVTIKDAAAKTRTTVIGDDGSYALDVTGMKAPYILEAKGSADGTDYKLYSFTDGPGTANVNPLSSVAVANAAGDADPEHAYQNSDSTSLDKIKNRLSRAIADLLKKLQPLLVKYAADTENPITVRYKTDHTRLDAFFDAVKIVIANGTVTITNAKNGAVIFTATVTDILNGQVTDDDGNVPNPGTAPTAPTGLTATGGASQVTLSWTAVGNATSYNLYWSTTTGVTTANGTKVAGVTSPYIQSGLTAGTTYYYVLTAANGAGESTASAQASATTTATPPPPPALPAAPAGVSSTGGTKQATISWAAVPGATSYNIYWATTTGVTKASGTKIAGAMSPTVQTGLADSTTYYYIVTAVNSTGEGAASVQVAATTLNPVPVPTIPAAPTGLSAAGGANQVTVSWSAVTGATSYNLYRSTTTGVTTATGTKIAGVTSPYVNTGLSAGTAYYYIVTAVNGVGESIASTQATATTNAPPPAVPNAPAGLTATGGAKRVDISWSASSGATSYNLYWSTASGFTTATGTKIAGATSPYAQTGLADGTAYYYIVTAVNVSGESAASAQAMATTSAPVPVIPAAPTGVSATGGAQQVRVSWSAVTGATSYNLYWSTTSGLTTATGTKITGATSPSTQTGLTAGTAYYYIVTAVNSAGESTASAQVTATTNPPPAVLCFSCHGTPPATGKHAFHFPSKTNTCATCHGAGYDPYGLLSALPATHQNGVTNIASGNPPGWNATTRSCSNSCHSTKAW